MADLYPSLGLRERDKPAQPRHLHRPVDIRRNLAAGTPWQRVIHRAEVAENFTPYHEGETHLSDDQFANWTNWRKKVAAADANGGALITLSQDAGFGPSIVGECRDRGPAWLCKGKLGSFVRRGKELVLWEVDDAGNYDYIQEFGFHDDGTISLRNGATGYLNPERPEVAHLHDSLWRIDLDVNGAGGDSAFLTRHIEPVAGDPSGLNSSTSCLRSTAASKARRTGALRSSTPWSSRTQPSILTDIQ